MNYNKTIIAVASGLSILPLVHTWVSSYYELLNKYELRSYFCPEFRFGISTLLMGAICYKAIEK